MNLPENCELVYIVSSETWYRDHLPSHRPSIAIEAASSGGGVAWEFRVEEHELGSGVALELRMFDDSWVAFEQIPEFFAALRTDRPQTLVDLRSTLDRVGARDATERTRVPAKGRGRGSIGTSGAALRHALARLVAKGR